MVYSMSFKDAIKTCFSKYFSFSGRARRSEYWYFALFKFLIYCPLYITALTISLKSGEDAALPFWIAYFTIALGLFMPSLAAEFRRLHDTGRSGWNILWYLIPFVGSIVVLVFLVTDSMPSTNRWGDNPKGEVSFSPANTPPPAPND